MAVIRNKGNYISNDRFGFIKECFQGGFQPERIQDESSANIIMTAKNHLSFTRTDLIMM